MGTEPGARCRDRPSSVEEDARLARYVDVTTHEGDLHVYDREEEGARTRPTATARWKGR